MAINFTLYTDAGLTIPVTGNLTFTVAEDGSTGWLTQQLWFGSNVASRKVQDNGSPGVTNIEFSVTDLGGVAGLDPTDTRLSLDGITWETPGDPLDTLVTEVESGVANAFDFFISAQVFGGATPGSYIDLRLITQTLREITA